MVFSEHAMIELDYEDLAGRTDEVFGEITWWLSAVPGSTMERQNPEPFSDLVSNYDEIAAALAGTRWEGFLWR